MKKKIASNTGNPEPLGLDEFKTSNKYFSLFKYIGDFLLASDVNSIIIKVQIFVGLIFIIIYSCNFLIEEKEIRKVDFIRKSRVPELKEEQYILKSQIDSAKSIQNEIDVINTFKMQSNSLKSDNLHY
ncbi:hypothetical protein GCM10027299_28770 [Larkinella ripae]